jgi:uncharacterized protein (TIGR02270 family)
MRIPLFIPDVVLQHQENAASLWLIRDNTVSSSASSLADIIKIDTRVEAHIDGLRTAESEGWSGLLDDLEEGGAGEYFAAGVLAAEGDDTKRMDQVIELAYARAAAIAKWPYHPAYDPWHGLVSALSWTTRAHAARTIGYLLDTPRPRTRWLGVAACGARRMVKQPGLETALADSEPLVRGRAAQTMGELGRSDMRAALNALLTDSDENCRYWSAWSAARLGTTEGLRALAEIARSPGGRHEQALNVVLRILPIERANTFLRPLARSPDHRRVVIRATAMIGDPLYVPWLASQVADPTVAQCAGEAFVTITGANAADLAADSPSDIAAGPNDDPADEVVEPSEDAGLPWLDSEKCGRWWEANRTRFSLGTAYFLGTPKALTDWLGVLMKERQPQRRSAALELALQRPGQAMFEVRARGDQQKQLLLRTGGPLTAHLRGSQND